MKPLLQNGKRNIQRSSKLKSTTNKLSRILHKIQDRNYILGHSKKLLIIRKSQYPKCVWFGHWNTCQALHILFWSLGSTQSSTFINDFTFETFNKLHQTFTNYINKSMTVLFFLFQSLFNFIIMFTYINHKL